MKLLGKLNASSLVIGDLIQVAGYLTSVTAVTISGVKVMVETEMFEPLEYTFCEKVSLFSKYSYTTR